MQNCSHEKITSQQDQNDWGDDMKNHMFLKTPAESLALAGHITFNSTHPTIKFTSEQSKQSIHFLDVTISINKNNTLSTDLYVKPTDTHQYLLSTSAHPKHTKQSIPYSLALRLRRICSEDETYKFRTKQLLQYLTKRGYKTKQTRKQIRLALKPQNNVKITEHHLLSPITPLCHSYLPSSNKTSTYYRTPQHAKKSSPTYPYSATVDLKSSRIYWFVQE